MNQTLPGCVYRNLQSAPYTATTCNVNPGYLQNVNPGKLIYFPMCQQNANLKGFPIELSQCEYPHWDVSLCGVPTYRGLSMSLIPFGTVNVNSPIGECHCLEPPQLGTVFIHTIIRDCQSQWSHFLAR